MSASDRTLRNMSALIGTEIGLSDWVTVDQLMIDAFADVTSDHQWIHIDPERAKETPFGATIAHGFLTLSLASRLGQSALTPPEGVTMSVNYGLDRVRFVTPVTVGSRVRGRFVLEDITRRNATSLLRKTALSIEIEGPDTPALAAIWLGLWVFAD